MKESFDAFANTRKERGKEKKGGRVSVVILDDQKMAFESFEVIVVCVVSDDFPSL